MTPTNKPRGLFYRLQSETARRYCDDITILFASCEDFPVTVTCHKPERKPLKFEGPSNLLCSDFLPFYNSLTSSQNDRDIF